MMPGARRPAASGRRRRLRAGQHRRAALRALEWLRRNLFGSRLQHAADAARAGAARADRAAAVPLGGAARIALAARRAPPAGRMARAGPSSACACRCSSTAAIRPSECWRVDRGAVAARRLRAAGAARACPPSLALGRCCCSTLFPLLAGILLAGGVFGLAPVDTNAVGRADARRADLLRHRRRLAAARHRCWRSAAARSLPVVRALSIGFIELWRGVPLLTVLFMSAVMVPLFLPERRSVDRLVRAMVALILFNAAYMAEVVRGGLQGVPDGQEEAAYSLGLHWWQVQALRRAAAGAAHRRARRSSTPWSTCSRTPRW